MSAPVPANEAGRLAALHAYAVLDTEAEGAYDDLTQLAAEICETPVALVTLVDAHRQWFKSKVGVDVSETPREFAFCAHTILESKVLQVPDATQDPRFKDNPMVIGAPGIRFYAGAPVYTPDGHALGTLCVVDRRARTLAPHQLRSLRVLAQSVSAQLEIRRKIGELAQVAASRESVVAEIEEELAAANARVAALPTCPACRALRG